MVDVALLFGPADYFALMVLAFTTVTAVLGSSLLRGLTSLLFGIGLGLVGIDVQTGQARYTLGVLELLDGINVVIVAVGLFAVGETFYVASRQRRGGGQIEAVKGSIWMNAEEWRRSWKPWLRGSLLGFPLRKSARGRRGNPDLFELCVGKAPDETPRRVRGGCD